MPVPDYQSLMLPVLKALAGGVETALSEVRARVADTEGLTREDLQEMLSSGQTVFENRVSWAISYMKKACLLERVRSGVYRLMPGGERLLSQALPRIDSKFLQKYPSYVERRQRKTDSDGKAVRRKSDDIAQTPEQMLNDAVEQLKSALEVDVLHRVCNATPAFLEKVVVDLLIAMGYGGGDAAKGKVTGRPGDGGIDGTINEDALGLDKVCVQAKKYAEDNTVGENDLRNFVGAIDAAGTTKGVFVTTARFTRAAKEYVKLSQKQVVLIDGKELARLMVRYGIGVQTCDRYEVKEIDENYFD